MKTKTTSPSKKLNSRIKAYSALAVSAIAIDASAQVGYTNIRDTTLINNGDFFDIDFNNDGINDVTVSLSTGSYSSSYSYSSVNVFFRSNFDRITADAVNGGIAVDSSYYAIAFSNNQAISAGTSSSPNNFRSGSNLVGSYSTFSSSYGSGVSSGTYSYGNFNGTIDKYLGVEFDISGSTHYGWIRLDVASQAISVTIKDFAYDSTANTSILAGDRGTLVGLETKSFVKTDFYSSHHQLNFRGQIPANTQLTIIDMKGQKVQEANLTENQSSQVLTNFSNGIYVVEIRDGKSVLRKKMWLEAN